jgi:hypothetical protein
MHKKQATGLCVVYEQKTGVFSTLWAKVGKLYSKKERLSPSFRVETAPRIKKNPD